MSALTAAALRALADLAAEQDAAPDARPIVTVTNVPGGCEATTETAAGALTRFALTRSGAVSGLLRRLRLERHEVRVIDC